MPYHEGLEDPETNRMHDDRSRLDRRRFLGTGVALLAGLQGARAFPLAGLAPTTSDAPVRAKSVIQVFLKGGLSHIDSFDPKPRAAAEIRGAWETVTSRAAGEPFSDRLVGLAGQAHRMVVIRSMTHGEAAHDRGTHNMLTGYRPSPALAYPSMGSIVSHELGAKTKLPPYICLPNARETHTGTGYLGSAYAPFSIGGEPARRSFKVQDLAPGKGIDAERSRRRRRLLADLDERFSSRVKDDGIEAAEAFHRQAYDLIDSPEARAAFDLRGESEKVRRAYGRTDIGHKLLMARRLTRAGARWVTVFDDGYDHHEKLYSRLDRKLRLLDRGVAGLINELARTGELDHTLVLVTTEFGRTPRVNQTEGRDHWPKVFSMAMAGGGLVRGVVHGASNADGSEPERDPVTPGDLAATVFHLLGIDHEKRLMSPGDRPIDIVRDGRVLDELIA